MEAMHSIHLSDDIYSHENLINFYNTQNHEKLFLGIMTRYNHILPLSDTRKSNHCRLEKLKKDIKDVLSKDILFTLKLIKKGIKSNSVQMLVDGTVSLICQNINITVTEESKEEIIDIIKLLLEYKRHPGTVFYFIKAFNYIPSEEYEDVINETTLREYLSVVVPQIDNERTILYLISYLLDYYPNILKIFDLKIIYKLIKRFIFYKIENVNIMNLISNLFYIIIDVNNNEDHLRYVRKLIKQLIRNCKFEECKNVCRKYNMMEFKEEIEMKEVENELLNYLKLNTSNSIISFLKHKNDDSIVKITCNFLYKYKIYHILKYVATYFNQTDFLLSITNNDECKDENDENDEEFEEEFNFIVLNDDINLVFLDKIEQLFTDLEIYMKYHEKSAIGVDMEWKPIRLESDVIIPSILQIAIDNHITILDLYTLCYVNKEYEKVREYIQKLFTYHIIYGFGIKNDIDILIESYPELGLNKDDFTVVDFDHEDLMKIFNTKQLSLKYLTSLVLNCNLDKTCQTSNWQDRPLSQQQLNYAGMDAHICLHILDRLLCKDYKDKLSSSSEILRYNGNDNIFLDNNHKCKNKNVDKSSLPETPIVSLPDNVKYSYEEIDNETLPGCMLNKLKECNLNSMKFYKFDAQIDGVDIDIDEKETHQIICDAFHCKISQCIKTVIFVYEEQYYGILLPIKEHIFIPLLASLLNCKEENKLSLLPSNLCEKVTGFKPGLIPPFYLSQVKQMFTSNSLLSCNSVVFGCGLKNTYCQCKMNDFMRLTNSTFQAISKNILKSALSSTTVHLPTSYYKHKYLCDGTLGKLCKWLRVLGYDCDYDPNNNNPVGLLYEAAFNDRVLLSSSKKLFTRREYNKKYAIYIKSFFLNEQISQLHTECGLDFPKDFPFDRCTQCNYTKIKVIKPEDAIGLIPQKVAENIAATNTLAYQCKACQQVFWKGQIYQEARAVLSDLVPDLDNQIE